MTSAYASRSAREQLVLEVDLVRAADEAQVEVDVAARLGGDGVEQRAVLGVDRLERVAGRPAARADDAARRRPAVVEVAAVHLADEVRLGADPRVLDRGQLVAPRGTSPRRPSPRRRSGCGVSGGVCSSCVGMPGRVIVDLRGRLAHVRDAEVVARHLADDGVVGGEAGLGQQVREVLAAPARRLVQADQHEHELALERAGLARARCAASSAETAAPFMSAEPRP